jgi:hypothetical protein
MKKLILLTLAVVLTTAAFFAYSETTKAATLNEGEGYGSTNDSINDAMLIVPGNTMNGLTADSVDWDYYKFISNEDGKINITFTNLEPKSSYSGVWTLFLYGPNGNNETIAMKTVKLSEGGSVVLPFIGAKAGNYYYLLVYTGPRFTDSHPYQIKTSFTKSKFYEKEFNNSEFAAGKYILANNYVGTIGGDFLDGDSNECYDRDYYHIKAPAKGKMTITLKHKKRNGLYDFSGWYFNLYKHHNGGNLTVSQTTIKLNSANDKKFYSATIAKGAEFWLGVKSIQDYSLQNGYYTYTPSDIVGEPYTISSTFELSAKPKLSYKATKNSITLKSKKLKDITGYEVEMKNGKKYKKLKTVNKKTLNYKKSGLKKNKKYTFRVRAYLKSDGTKYYGKWVTITAKTKKK